MAAAPPPGRAIAAPSSDDPSTTPVEGRILDLEGRPVAGATVAIKYVQSPPDGKLDAWIDEIKRLGKQPWAPEGNAGHDTAVSDHRPRRPVPDRWGSSRRHRDGLHHRSRDRDLRGLHPDARLPTIRVKDPMLAGGPKLVYYGARFDHVAARSRPIIGTIRDKDTGAPIAGVHITGMPNIPSSMIPTPGVEATSDAQGQYQVNGLPTSSGFKLFTKAPAGQPYVNHGFICPGERAQARTVHLRHGPQARGARAWASDR